jgi:hypothetical protein
LLILVPLMLAALISVGIAAAHANRAHGGNKSKSKGPRPAPQAGLGSRALSQACAAFYVHRDGLLRIVSESNEPSRLGVRE